MRRQESVAIYQECCELKLTPLEKEGTLTPFINSQLFMSSTATAEMPTAASNKPIAKTQLGNISVSVFPHEVQAANGSKFTAKNFVLQKSWKDKEGNWHDQSISLKSREILAVQKALDEAFVGSYGVEDEE